MNKKREDFSERRKAYMRYVRAYLNEHIELLGEKGIFSLDMLVKSEANFNSFTKEMRTYNKSFKKAFELTTTPSTDTLDRIHKAFKIDITFWQFDKLLDASNPEYVKYLVCTSEEDDKTHNSNSQVHLSLSSKDKSDDELDDEWYERYLKKQDEKYLIENKIPNYKNPVSTNSAFTIEVQGTEFYEHHNYFKEDIVYKITNNAAFHRVIHYHFKINKIKFSNYDDAIFDDSNEISDSTVIQTIQASETIEIVFRENRIPELFGVGADEYRFLIELYLIDSKGYLANSPVIIFWYFAFGDSDL